MKLIIAGTRTMEVPETFIMESINNFNLAPTQIVSGCAQGIDESGEKYAMWAGLQIKHCRADWETHGKAAGPMRNREMSQYADALLLIWDGESPGSANMKLCMSQLCKPTYEIILRTSHVK